MPRHRKVPLASLRCRYRFPDPETGVGEHGVIGVGPLLDPDTVLVAYHLGIFPWPAPDMEADLVFWCSPDPRAVLRLDGPLHWSRSLRRSMRSKPFRITIDEAFAHVMDGCGDRREGTWITASLRACYLRLFEMGWAHSLEVWNTRTGELAGGIYGLAIGSVFVAESMFHRETDASKVAFATLAETLRGDYELLDAETMNPHLESLGCVTMPRSEYLELLVRARRRRVEFPEAPVTPAREGGR